MKSQHQRLGILCPVFRPQALCPYSAGGAELGDLLEEIDVGIKEERYARHKLIDVQPACNPRLDISKSVGECECQFLTGCRTGLPDVVAADRNRIPLRNLFVHELEHVDNELHVRVTPINPILLLYL